MAKATTKATTVTTLRIGKVELAVGLFSTVAKPSKLADFDTGGPNGGALKARAIAKAVPVAEQQDVPPAPETTDPFADAPPVDWGTKPVGDAISTPIDVPGQYGTELVEEGTGIVVAPQDVRKGVRLEDGRFIDCTAQLAQIGEDTKLEGMDVIAFIDSTHIPRAWVKGALYVGANDEHAPRGLRLLYEGLKATRRAAVVKVTKRSRQTLGAITVFGGTLLMLELVWSEDLREPPSRALLMRNEGVSDAQVARVTELIGAMSGSPAMFHDLRDDAIALREALKAQALAGEVAEVVTPPVVAEQEDDVMAQLEASLAAVA